MNNLITEAKSQPPKQPGSQTATPTPRTTATLPAELEEFAASLWTAEGILTRDPGFIEILAILRRVARTQSRVLITGETGTGKELAARALHHWSPRCSHNFVAINCAALAPEIVCSELFGHVRGAFTGALTARNGLFAEADGGTLFLDEIDELPANVQAMILRFLQEGVYRRVGGNRDERADVRVVSATQRSLRTAVDEGRFRQDLLFRLNVIPLQMPPLRERRGDIATLWKELVAKSAARLACDLPIASAEIMARLEAYHWPGNVRELLNLAEMICSIGVGGEIPLSALPPEIRNATNATKFTVTGAPASALTSAPTTTPPGITPRRSTLTAVAIDQALESVGGSVTKAAARLNVSRVTLWKRRRELARKAQSANLESTRGKNRAEAVNLDVNASLTSVSLRSYHRPFGSASLEHQRRFPSALAAHLKFHDCSQNGTPIAQVSSNSRSIGIAPSKGPPIAPSLWGRLMGNRRSQYQLQNVLFVVLMALQLATPAPPALAARHYDEEILLVGNSLSRRVKKTFWAIAASAGRAPYLKVLAKNGYTLEQHFKSKSTVSRLTLRPWTAIILQEQSAGLFYERYEQVRFAAAKAQAQGSRLTLMMTWRDRDAPLVYWESLREIPELPVGYLPIAREVGADVSPVGWAFRRCAIENVVTDLWARDGHHPSETGSYLAALVLYTTVYGSSPRGLWHPSKLSLTDAEYLQRIAEETVLNDSATWSFRP